MSPLTGFLRVEMLLRDVLYVSYLVHASRVRPMVPDILPLATLEGDNVFVSVVVLESTGVRLSYLPFPRFSYRQVNVRTYVTDPQTGNRAVYFLRSGVTSRFISRITGAIGVPWQHIECTVDVTADSHRYISSYEVSGYWDGEFSIEAEESILQPVQIPPFDKTEAAVDYLVRPLIGFMGQNGRVGRFSIWHPEVKPRAGEVGYFKFPLLDSMNLFDGKKSREQQSVLLVSRARFYIYMPPAKVKL